MIVKKANKNTINDVIILINKEFTDGTYSVANKYKKIFEKENYFNIYVIEKYGKIVSAVVVKDIEYYCDSKIILGSLIGFVCTDKNYRNRGFSGAILKEIENDKIKQNKDFMALWTSINGFYSKFGWKTKDVGVFGNIAKKRFVCDKILLKYEKKYDRIEKIRRNEKMFVLRNEQDYFTIPKYVDRIECIRFGNFYVLFGVKKNSAYIYEVIGNTKFYKNITKELLKYEKIYFNDEEGGKFFIWLKENGLVDGLIKQRGCMWKIFNKNMPIKYIEFYDRI